HREKFVKKGISGFKLDKCDNSDFNASNWSFPDTAMFPSGMDGEQMHAAIGKVIRRMETICFSAHAIYNAWRIPNPPWKQVDIEKNLAGEWMQDSEYYTTICRKYHKLRMSLLPYLYSLFVKYWKEGFPPIRALVFD
ncbi:MAG: glycoside hydrolase, partial [Lachnospiraceae bacterium]|nr:glycoside hydrolase [Lachnospiraceae bacterium]